MRSVSYQLKTAKFPTYLDISGFDFMSSMANEALIRQLCAGDFMDNAQFVVFVGGPGTGKTHLASTIGIQAIEQLHRRVHFFSTIELVNALEKEKQQGKAGQIASRLMHTDLVILVEMGYLPFSKIMGFIVPLDE